MHMINFLIYFYSISSVAVKFYNAHVNVHVVAQRVHCVVPGNIHSCPERLGYKFLNEEVCVCVCVGGGGGGGVAFLNEEAGGGCCYRYMYSTCLSFEM